MMGKVPSVPVKTRGWDQTRSWLFHEAGRKESHVVLSLEFLPGEQL